MATKRKEANLWDLAADLGVKAQQGFLSKLDAVQVEAAGLQRQIGANEELLARSVRPLTDAEAAEKAAEMRKLLLNADIKLKRRFVQAVIHDVVVNDDEVRIEGVKSNLAETAAGVDIASRPPVRGFDREWCAYRTRHCLLKN